MMEQPDREPKSYRSDSSGERAKKPVKRPARNVLGGVLQPCSMDPLTGFYRDGCCNMGLEDRGLHLVCCVCTDEFLEHQAEMGNDLITPRPQWGFPGLEAGDRWCVCVTRWKQSFLAGKACPVILESTHVSTLEFVRLEELEQYALRD